MGWHIVRYYYLLSSSCEYHIIADDWIECSVYNSVRKVFSTIPSSLTQPRPTTREENTVSHCRSLRVFNKPPLKSRSRCYCCGRIVPYCVVHSYLSYIYYIILYNCKQWHILFWNLSFINCKFYRYILYCSAEEAMYFFHKLCFIQQHL